MSEQLLVRLTEQNSSREMYSPYTSIPLLTPDKDQRSKAFVFSHFLYV